LSSHKVKEFTFSYHLQKNTIKRELIKVNSLSFSNDNSQGDFMLINNTDALTSLHAKGREATSNLLQAIKESTSVRITDTFCTKDMIKLYTIFLFINFHPYSPILI
jgi:hypothetical protein